MNERLAKELSEYMDRMFHEARGGTASNVDQPETILNVENMLHNCDQIIRDLRRTQITFVVDFSHQGPIIWHDTPCDGKRVEMNFIQAQELHRHWPIKLHKVLTTVSAEFVPVSGIFNEYVSLNIPLPPFKLPSEDE